MTFKSYVKAFLLALERTTERTKDNLYDMVYVEVGIRLAPVEYSNESIQNIRNIQNFY